MKPAAILPMAEDNAPEVAAIKRLTFRRKRRKLYVDYGNLFYKWQEKDCLKCESSCDGSFLYCIVELCKSLAFDGKFDEKPMQWKFFLFEFPD